jgi:hypothetical protein
MGDEGMLGVVQDQQVQVSNDGGLNNIPIEVATMTVRACQLPVADMGHTLFCLLFSIILLSTSQSYHQYLLVFFSRMTLIPLKWWMTTRCCLAAFRLVVILD